ncbi:M24 family metallopeptidase [Sutterella sp.]|uniref:M24 family metallopeptidase n=1 Tax=Sutterella sp. TaxID=1981025 RepID=UPI0026E0F06F|nr:M24 family metallopeptidase [Sutterella sp.]MDO5530753.1 M24 family metallopeptidase [Sutterella sp.]
MNTREKLEHLREWMRTNDVAALYVTSADPHQSEAVAAHWKTLQWLSGFTGSACTAALTLTEAAFWTDGRYTTQAGREVDGDAFTIFTTGIPGTPTLCEWLRARLKPGERLSLPGEVLSVAQLESFRAELPGVVITADGNPAAELRESLSERPALPDAPVWPFPGESAVTPRVQKLAAERAELSRIDPQAAALLTGLEEIGWITNLRGDDHPLYPLFHAFALVGPGTATLFADRRKFTDDIVRALAADGWELRARDAVPEALSALPLETVLRIDPFRTPAGFLEAVPAGVRVSRGPEPAARLRAIHSAAEIESFLEANRLEAVAVIRLMRWIEENAGSGELTEYGVGQQLEHFRRQMPGYLHPGNIPIVGYGANAALPHYRPGPEKSDAVRPEGFLLFDVCAQYRSGTTDLTRTVAVGELTDEMKRDYTRVLRAHLTLARQRFPAGTTGNLLDAIVKSTLWREAISFNHGTGHGIGYVSNVHEGPGKISIELAPAFPWAHATPLEPGMVFSDEPGIYRPGRHGIRIENAVAVEEDTETEFGRFLRFRTLTFLPYERKAILVADLTREEIEQVNAYHHEVLERIGPALTEDERRWLWRKTLPIG